MSKVNDLGQQILKSKYLAADEKTPEDLFLRVAKVGSIPDVIDFIYTRETPKEEHYLVPTHDETLRAIFGPYTELAKRVIQRRGIDTAKEIPQRRFTTAADQWNILTNNYYSSMCELDFMPATPVLINAGRGGMLSSCFFLRVPDSIEGIFDSVKKVGLISKAGGGVGLDISALRPSGAAVGVASGTSSGPISFLRIFNTACEAIKSGGVRRAALLGAMSVYHPDILDFIHCKEKEGELSNFNLSVFVDNNFMAAVRSNKEIVLQHEKSTIKKTVSALEIWNELVKHAWHLGDPGIIFEDTLNNADIFHGKLGKFGVNPCLHKNTLLLDDDCIRKISDNDPKQWTSWKVGKKETIKLTCNNGMTLICTPEHKIILPNGKEIEAKYSLNKSIKWGLGHRKSDIIDKKSVLQGFLFGDGFVCGRKHGVSVKLNREKEIEVVELLEEFGFHQQACQSFYINYDILSTKVDVTFLKDRVHHRKIPDYIVFGNSTVVRSFLLGLFSANGSCSIVGQISLKGTYYPSIKKIQILLASFGVPSWICPNVKTKIKWSNGEYTSRRSYNLQIAKSNSRIFAEKIGFLHKYKMDRIIETDHQYSTPLIVKSIRPYGIEEVWDYNMNEPPHRNVCNGIVTKNCGEIPIREGECCTLSAINLSNCYNEQTKSIDTDKIQILTRLGIQFLDNLVDLNDYPLPEIEQMSLRSRKVGLGSTGLHDLLLRLEIPYGGNSRCLQAIDTIYSTIKKAAIETSTNLGRSRGIPEELKNINVNRRNSELLTCQPAGTISQICNQVSSGIEPVFQWEYTRKDTFGVHKMKHFMLDKFGTEENLPEYAKTALEISPKDHVKVQAQLQKYIDCSVSKTVNVPNEATIDNVDYIYRLAHKLGCKSITVYRSGSRKDEVLVKKDPKEVPVEEETTTEDEEITVNNIEAEVDNIDNLLDKPTSRPRPSVLFGATFKINTPGGKAYITINEDSRGIREVFIHISKAGSEIATHVEAEGRLISHSLKHGIPADTIISHLAGHKSNPIFDSGRSVKSVPDAVALVMQEYKAKFEGFSEFIETEQRIVTVPTKPVGEISGELCPECGEVLYMASGCTECASCGFSQCG